MLSPDEPLSAKSVESLPPYWARCDASAFLRL